VSTHLAKTQRHARPRSSVNALQAQVLSLARVLLQTNRALDTPRHSPTCVIYEALKITCAVADVQIGAIE
jgi:hypothetical protein